jgi:hypothetical protein
LRTWRTQAPDRDGRALAAYVQNRFALGERTYVTPGVRVESFSFDRNILRRRVGGVPTDVDITPDGKRLYFSSSRPVDGEPRGVFDIWYLEREGESWGEPVRLGAEINSDRDELYASASADGTLYWRPELSGVYT